MALLRALSKGQTNLLHDLLLSPKCSSAWYKERKIEGQVNHIVPFYEGDLVKEKRKSSLKVSLLMLEL